MTDQLTLDVAFIGAIAILLAALIGSLVNAWNQRRLTRDTELRKWRLEQMRPTLEEANRSLVHLFEIQESYHRPGHEINQEYLGALGPFRHLGHSTIIARVGTKDLSRPLNEYMDAYNTCVETIVNRASRGTLTGGPPPSLLPPESEMKRLIDAVMALNQATERYAFGHVGYRTLPEVEKSLAKIERILAILNGSWLPGFSWINRQIRRHTDSGDNSGNTVG